MYIKKVLEIGHFVDVPCYIDTDAMKKATEITFEEALQQKDAGVLQILAPLSRNVNTPNATLKEVLRLELLKLEFLNCHLKLSYVIKESDQVG